MNVVPDNPGGQTPKCKKAADANIAACSYKREPACELDIPEALKSTKKVEWLLCGTIVVVPAYFHAFDGAALRAQDLP